MLGMLTPFLLWLVPSDMVSNLNDPVQKPREQRKKQSEVFVEALYLKPYEDGLRYAEDIEQDGPIISKYKPINQRFRYEFGFRVGAAFPIHCDEWRIGANWMYFSPSPGSVHKSSKDQSIIAGLITSIDGLPNANEFVGHVKGHWEFTLNSIDLTLSRCFIPTPHWMVTPSAGVKFGSVYQHVRVRYHDVLITNADADTPTKVRGKNQMYGVGPLLGLNATYWMPHHWGIMVAGEVAFLFENFDTKTNYRDFTTIPDGKINMKNDLHRIGLVEQLQISLNKKWVFHPLDFELRLGWELQIWKQQMRLDWFSTLVNQLGGEDLVLSGPFLNATFHF